MNTPDEKQETAQTAAHNPFPEPQTIPAGWDTSEFLITSQSSDFDVSAAEERPEQTAT